MEGHKKSNWADESEEDSSEQEKPAPDYNSQVIAQDSKRDALVSSVKTQSLPLTFYLSNLPFKITEQELLKELKVSKNVELKFEYGDRGFNGLATLKANNLEDALKVAERNKTYVFERLFIADLARHSYNRDRNRGSGQGHRRGGGGRRGYEENTKNYERGYDSKNQSKKYYKPQEKQEEEKYENKYQNKTKAESKPTKISIAPSDNPLSTGQTQPKPRSNPFGEAKPVDILNKELEFEKKIDSDKKQADEPHEKRYVKKEQKESENKLKEEVFKDSNQVEEPARKDNQEKSKIPEENLQTTNSENPSQRLETREGLERAKDEEATSDAWGEPEERKDYKRNYEGGYNRNTRSRRRYDTRRGDRRRGNKYQEETREEKPEKNYVRHFENKNKEVVRGTAWGDPEQAAEILKKPKESGVIQGEEKQTKKGTNYVKRSFKE